MVLCRQFIETTPLGWISEQSEVQVVHPIEQPVLSPEGRRSPSESPGTTKGCLAKMQQRDNPRAKKRELRGGLDG